GLLGRMQYASGDVNGALESFGRAVPILRQVQNRGPLAEALMTWAEAGLGRGQTDAAPPTIDGALQPSRTIGNDQQQAQALYLQARAFQKKAKIDDAIVSISNAIGLVETMRESIAATDLRTSYFTTVRSYYDLQIELLQQIGRTADAFNASESARA